MTRTRAPEAQVSGRLAVAWYLDVFSYLLILLGGVLLAWQNFGTGRGDRRGAFRLAAFVFAARIASWLLYTPYYPDVQGQARLLMSNLALSLYLAAISWMYYIALEPYVRRHWPDTLISWSRMLSGKFKDPVLARDVLIGVMIGLAGAVLEQLQPIVESSLGKPPQRPLGLTSAYALEGLRGSIATVLYQASTSFSSALLIFFMLTASGVGIASAIPTPPAEFAPIVDRPEGVWININLEGDSINRVPVYSIGQGDKPRIVFFREVPM